MASSNELRLTRKGYRYFKTQFVYAMELTNPKANPGYPLYGLGYASNKDVFEQAPMSLFKTVLSRVIDHVNGRPHADMVRLFVKNEPHPLRKKKTKSWRLIMNVSLIDVLVEKLLFNKQNKAEIAAHRVIYSRPGMGNEDEDFQSFIEMRDKLPGDYNASADVRGFDWSVQAWQLRWDAVTRCILAGQGPDSWYSRAVMSRVESLIQARLLLSDGRVFQPTIPGIQLSGSNNTSSTNSRIRAFIAMLIGAKWALSNGDDCVESPSEGAPEAYAYLGHTLRFYDKTIKSRMEFCSHQYNGSEIRKVLPCNYQKALFTLLCQTMVSAERMDQYAHYLRHQPSHVKEVRTFLARLGRLETQPGNLL